MGLWGQLKQKEHIGREETTGHTGQWGGWGWLGLDRSQRVNRLTLLYSVMHCKDRVQGKGLADEKWENRKWGLQLPHHGVWEIQTCLSTPISHTSFLAGLSPSFRLLMGLILFMLFVLQSSCQGSRSIHAGKSQSSITVRTFLFKWAI